MYMTYQDGRIIGNPEVSPIFVGPVSKGVQTAMVDFYTNIWDSPWTEVMTQYSALNSTGWWYPVTGSGSMIQAHHLQLNKIKVDDILDVQPWIRKQIQKGVITFDTSNLAISNSYFPIFFTPNVIVTSGERVQSCINFCSYHGSVDISDMFGQPTGTTYFFYSLHPDLGNNGCIAPGACGPLDVLGNTMMVASHELSEVMTNPDAAFLDQGDGEGGMPWSWSDSRPYSDGSEVADICNLRNGTTTGGNGKKYSVQLLYSNITNSCEDHLGPTQAKEIRARNKLLASHSTGGSY
ncbi:hypothetical protein BC830DRAFT_1113776 [Chytriomyces sp. MP71]|nr:hypothetical protein BC830DRAFT_1113776 [Chytriomyces sp. MP71]